MDVFLKFHHFFSIILFIFHLKQDWIYNYNLLLKSQRDWISYIFQHKEAFLSYLFFLNKYKLGSLKNPIVWDFSMNPILLNRLLYLFHLIINLNVIIPVKWRWLCLHWIYLYYFYSKPKFIILALIPNILKAANHPHYDHSGRFPKYPLDQYRLIKISFSNGHNDHNLALHILIFITLKIFFFCET